MNFAPYPNYKPSGVDWLGDVPVGWESAKLYLLSRRYTGGTPSKEIHEYWENGTIPWLNSGTVNQFTITEPSAYITQKAYQNSSAKWVPKGALLVALAGQGKTKGMAAQTTFATTCNQSMAAIVWEKENPRFMLWWLTSQYKNIRGLASGDARDGLNLEMIGSIQCPIPPLNEQKAIAGFLDEKTGAIDALIAKKQTLLKLLAEKRTALITHAVTKGLNPKAPLKKSGIDWLGDVPERWEVKRLRFALKSNPPDSEFNPDPSKLVSFIPMRKGKEWGGLTLDLTKFPDEVGSGYTPFADNDVVVAKITPCFENGKGALARNLMNGIAYGTTELHVLRVFPKTSYEYLFYLTMSYPFRKNGEAAMYGAGGQKRISEKFIKDFSLGFPPLNEQKAIAEYLDTKTKEMDTVKSKTKQLIKRLKEYRAALITSAVTGKIKVV